MNAQKEMPLYDCHKKVWALKIKKVGISSDRIVLVPENNAYGLIEVSGEYIDKHNPQEGGYYVVYKGGYKSYSPAEAFEDGYSLAEPS